METQELNIEFFGKKLGRISAVKDPHQEEITIIFKVEPDSDLEIRTSSFSANNAQFTFKEK